MARGISSIAPVFVSYIEYDPIGGFVTTPIQMRSPVIPNERDVQDHMQWHAMLEHLTIPQLDEMLQTFKNVSEYILCVVPIGDNGLYRIPEYHMEVSHLIAENEEWWSNKFIENGWSIEKHTPHVVGMKDNWQNHANGLGNHVFVLKK